MKVTLVTSLDFWRDAERVFELQGDGEDLVFVVNGTFVLPKHIFCIDRADADGLTIKLFGYSEQPMPERRIIVHISAKRWTIDLSDEQQMVYGIGESRGTLITHSMQMRYRALQGLRDWLSTFKLCVTEERSWDDEVLICGHPPEMHDEDGCKGRDYDDYGVNYCQCEHYTRPAPLVRIECQ